MVIPTLLAHLTSVRAFLSFFVVFSITAATLADFPNLLGGELLALAGERPARERVRSAGTLSLGFGSTCNPINTGVVYTQDFNTLAVTGPSSVVPMGWLFAESGTAANTVYGTSSGTSTAGDTYSLGSAGSTDRAFGGLQTGSLVPIVGGCFVNNTGAPISAVNIAYDGEQWRLGATGRTDRLDFEYSLDAVSLTTGTWTAVDQLDFAAPVSSGTAGALDGNINKVAVAGSISGLAIPNGATFFIRYLDLNATGADDALGVDNFSLSAGGGVPTIELGSGTYIEDESQTLVVSVIREGIGSSSIDYATADVTATSGSCPSGADYEPQTGTLTFSGSESLKLINIPLCQDLLKDPSETFTITLSNPVNATLGSPATGVAEINDTAAQFVNPAPIVINDTGVSTPYPSQISVSGAAGSVYFLRVTLFDISGDIGDDLNFLLVGPAGHSFVLMADAGGAGPIQTGTTLTFNDNSPDFVPDNSGPVTGSYRPSSWDNVLSVFPAPAPAGPHGEPGPGGTPMPRSAFMNAVFGGTNPNGIWSLYIFDDDGSLSFAPGVVGGGWGIEVIAPSAASLSLSGKVTDSSGRGIRSVAVMLEGGGLVAPRSTTTGSLGHYSFDTLSSGTYVLTVNSKRYSFAVPTRMITMVDSVTDADFVAEPLE